MDRYHPLPPATVADATYQPLPYSFVSLEGFLDAKLLVEILNRMGPHLEKQRLQQVVESIQDLDLGIDVPVSFGRHKHQGLDRVYYTVVENGRFVRLEDWSRWSQ